MSFSRPAPQVSSEQKKTEAFRCVGLPVEVAHAPLRRKEAGRPVAQHRMLKHVVSHV